jgi:serine/threonine protein kinase
MRVCEVCKRCYSNDVDLCSTESHLKLTGFAAFGPDVIAGYKIERRLTSATGVSRFCAKQTATNSDCLISIISLEHADAEQFLSEAKLAASTVHSGVSTVYEYGILDSGEGFLVSEYTASRSVKDVLQEGAPQLLTSIQIVVQTADALDLLHSNGVVHGAIRPENVLFYESDGHVRIRLQNVDLAAATRNSILSNKLTMDASSDSLQYFAPEQLSPGKNEASGDVYALGVVLFELLSGSPPFTGESAAEIIEKQRNEHPPEIKIPNYELRMLLANTLMESLQKHASLRLPSALAFARQMRHIEQLATHSSTPPPVVNVPRLKVKSAAASASYDAQQLVDVVLQTSNQTPTPAKKIKPAEVESLLEESSQALFISARTREKVASIQNEGEEELNRFRLNYWKEKYGRYVSKPKSPKTPEQRWDSILNLDTPAKRAAVIDATPTAAELKENPPERKRIKIEWQQPTDGVPTMEDVRKTLARAPVLPATVPATAAVVENPGVEIESAEPLPIKRRLLRTRDASPGMFSFANPPIASKKPPFYASIVSADSMTSLLRSIDQRVLIAGISSIFVLGILFSIYSFSGSEEHAATVDTAKPVEITLPPVTVEEPRQTAVQVDDTVEDVPAFVPNAKANEQQADRDIKVVKAKADEPAAKDSSNGSATAKNIPVKNSADVVTAPVASSALKPSTLVISASNGRVDKRVESANTVTARRTAAGQSNAAGATRPRVVANPKP